jgi:hypothetical protein
VAQHKLFSQLSEENHAAWWQPEDLWGEHWIDAIASAELSPQELFAAKFHDIHHNNQTLYPIASG